MSYRTKKVWFHCKPGLRDILSEAGVSGVMLFTTANISKATFQEICKGAPFVSAAIRQKVIHGVVLTCGERYCARVESLWQEVPNAEVKINGDKMAQARLRNLARQHGLTPLEYLAKLIGGPRDPLHVLETCFTGQKNKRRL